MPNWLVVEPSRWRDNRSEVYGESGHIFRRLVELDEGNGGSWLVAEHIARWDPARVLAECRAKRRIVELGPYAEEEGGGYANAYADILPLLALPYADHPDYRDEWRP